MANRRISELQELAGLDLADQDLFTVVHVNEVDPTLKNRKLTISGTRQYLNTYYLQNTGGTISGAVIVQGNLTVSGSTNFATATFTGVVTVGSLIAQSGATVSGTISGATITGSNIQGTNVNGVLGNFTTLTGGELNFTTGNFLQRISGVTITGASGAFTSLTGQTITGTTVNVQTITGNGATFTTLTGNTAGFTSITGATVTGTSGNFVSGVFTSRISGLTITGVSGAFTSLTGVTVTGTTANFASGVFTTQISGATITGTSGGFISFVSTTGSFTNLTGVTTTGTTANFVAFNGASGVFTTLVSGTTVTGTSGGFVTLNATTGNFTSITGTTITGTTVAATTGIFSTITFTGVAVAGNLSVSGSGFFGSGVSVTGTISGVTITGTSGQFSLITGGSAGFTSVTGVTVTGTTANFVSGVFTTQISGAAITGNTAGFTTVTGVTITGTTANFASGVFTTQISGATITGTTVIATTGNYTSLTGVTTTGTTANFVTYNGASGIFTTLVSGATVTGQAGQFSDITGVRAGFGTVTGVTVTGTTANFVTLSGTTVTGQTANFTSGVFASGTAGAPSVSVGTTSNGFYSPGTNQLAISTSGTGRLYVDASGNVGIGNSSPSTYGKFVVAGSVASSGLEAWIQNTTDTGGDNTRYAGLSFSIGTDYGTAAIRAYRTNSATDYSTALTFWTKGSGASATTPTERMRIDSSGNVGIGVVPSAWVANSRAIQILAATSLSQTANGYTNLSSNSYESSIDTYKYIGGGFASLYQQLVGQHRWYTAPSGTAGNTISFTQAMTLDASGRLGIGTASPSQKLQISAGNVQIDSNYGFIWDNSTTGIYGNGSPSVLQFYTGNAERMRVTSTAVGIGTTSPQVKLHVQSDLGGISEGLRLSNEATFTTAARGVQLTFRGTSGGLLASIAGITSTSANDQGYLAYTANGATGFHIFYIDSSERMRIDSSGRLLVGTSSAGSVLTKTIELAGAGTGTSQPCYQVYSFPGASDISCGYFQFYKSRGATVGTNTIVASGDILGQLYWYGANGTGYDIAAAIKAEVDGTPGASSDMPGRLVFSTTADGAASPTERYRITNDGVMCHDQPAPTSKNSTATLTIAELKTGIIHFIGATGTLTLPTGTLMEGGFSGIYTNMAFEWSVINTGDTFTGVCTIGAGTNHTIVGKNTIEAFESARFTSRRTAANTFVSYRLS